MVYIGVSIALGTEASITEGGCIVSTGAGSTAVSTAEVDASNVGVSAAANGSQLVVGCSVGSDSHGVSSGRSVGIGLVLTLARLSSTSSLTWRQTSSSPTRSA